jgi:hypothetical protein
MAVVYKGTWKMRSSRKYILLPHRPLAWEAASLNPTRVDAWASESHEADCSWAGECTRRKVPVPQVHVTYYLVSIAYDPASPRSVQRNSKLSKSHTSFKDFPGLSAPRG